MSPASAQAVRPAVPLLEVLLRIRRDMKSRTMGPYEYIGMPDVEWMTCFVNGYAECLHCLGVEEGADGLFGEWFRDVKKAWPGEGWGSAYVKEFHGDQDRALLKYLDFVAEFRSLSAESLACIPWHFNSVHPATALPSWTPTRPPNSTLELLMDIRQQIGDVPGRLSLFIGTIDVRRMAGFVDGYRLCLALSGFRDEEYARFERWLHDVKQLPAGQQWPSVYLQRSGGDAQDAIRQWLTDAALFRGL